MRTPLLLLLLAIPLHAQEIDVATFAHKRFTVCRVDPSKQQLRLFWRADSGEPFKSFAALDHWLRDRGRKLTFAMNGGMYHGDFSPVGLYVEEGREWRPLNLSRGEGNFFLQPNGVFALTSSGVRVVESSKYSPLQKTVKFATQSGPMLVMNGRIHPAFKPNSSSLLFRNGVGVDASRRAVFVISEEPVNFYEFALLFRDALHCSDALFLDGTISSLHSAALKRSDKKMDLGPIIAITDPL